MLSKEVSSTIFKVFGMTQPGIEPRSPRPLVTVNERTFLERSQTIFEIKCKYMLDLRINLNLTELKQQLIDFLICSIYSMEALSIHYNLRYTWHISSTDFSLVEDCQHLYLMVLEITSLGYPLFSNIFFINSNSSARFCLKQIMKA